MASTNTHHATEDGAEFVVRSVRYYEPLYTWLQARAGRFNRSIQRENTYLLERLRQRPDIVDLLDSEPLE